MFVWIDGDCVDGYLDGIVIRWMGVWMDD